LERDWELDPQWLVAMLQGGDIDWTSGYVYLQWPTKLQLTIYAGDGARYLHNAWAFIVDGVNNNNVTAALTDDAGYPNSIDITDSALAATWAADPLATSNPPGSRLNLGFNLGYEDWAYVVNGTVNSRWYDGTEYTVFCTSGSGKWIVKVFWKVPDAGTVLPYGKVEGVSVWDTFRDQPQHRYIYLGIPVPPTATGEDNATAQVRTFSTKVYDLKIKVVDQTLEARPVDASLKVTLDKAPWLPFTKLTESGEYTIAFAPDGKYGIEATARAGAYGKPAPKATVSATVVDAPSTILVQMPIYDATIQLVTPSGAPIPGATVTVGNTTLQGITDPEGKIVAPSIPGGSYNVGATLYGQSINPTLPLNVGLTRTYVIPAGNMALVTVKVTGAQNQGLSKAAITVTIGTTKVFSGETSEDGVLTVWLPKQTYDIAASHKGMSDHKSVAVTGDADVAIQLGTFIELFGQGMSFVGFALWIVAILIVFLILVIAAQEYNIYRRKRLPQLFGAGPTR